MEDILARKAAFYKSCEISFFFSLIHGRTDTDADFQVILERELKRNNLKETPESKSFLAFILIPEIDRLINLHKENRTYGIGLNAPLLQHAERFKGWLLKKEPLEHKQTIKNPVIALFCFLINDAGIMAKAETESTEKYCKRICHEFKLPYAVRVSKGFYNSQNKSNIIKIKELILPIIDKEVSDQLVNYLDTMQLQKQKLYG